MRLNGGINGRQLERLVFHQKAVTCLYHYSCATYDKSRILSSSLDGAVRVIDPLTYTVLHNFKFPDPVLSVAVSVGIHFSFHHSLGM